jgi:putative ABC transport system permease protein
MVFVVRETEGRTFRAMHDSVASIPGVEAFSARAAPWPVQGTASISPARQGGARIQVFQDGVGPDYFATIGARLIAGRDFSPDHAEDLAPPDAKKNGAVSNVVIDRSLAGHYGWSPTAALGKTLFEFGSDWIWQMTVIGVVEDRPVASIRGEASSGAIYHFDGERVWFPILRISRDTAASTTEAALAALNALAPDQPTSLESEAAIYRDYDQDFATIGLLFDGLALFTFGIAVVGLIGMAMQTIGRRRHEIGIRKTLGASNRTILGLLLTSFTRPVLIASVAAWPVAYGAAQAYLSLFIKRESLSVSPFLISLAVTAGVAVLAVGLQTLRAARANPANILRYE